MYICLNTPKTIVHGLPWGFFINIVSVIRATYFSLALTFLFIELVGAHVIFVDAVPFIFYFTALSNVCRCCYVL